MDRRAEVAAQTYFSLAHPEYYEPLERIALGPEYQSRLRALLPDGWTLWRNDVWLHARPPDRRGAGRRSVAQGFKIHVSAATWHAEATLDRIVPLCAAEMTEFKIAGDRFMLAQLNSKLQRRSQSGKFMTVYPDDEQAFVDLIEKLYLATRDSDLAGPYILSDRRYKDSRILYYRYGGFRPPYKVNIDGTRTTFLTSPDGSYVADERLPYVELPAWVSDPFPSAAPADDGAPTMLGGRYIVEGVLGFSNSGGVYYGRDATSDRPVVVKEARPLTNCWSIGGQNIDAVAILAHEHRVLDRLQGLDCAPAVLDFFREWEHSFLIEERIDGLSLFSYWAQEDVILTPYIRRPGRIEAFVPRFRHVARQLIEIVKTIHARGVVLGDVSPYNIMVSGAPPSLRFIDFESAMMDDDSPAFRSYSARWGTAGYMPPGRDARSAPTKADDWYALAMTLLGSIVPANYFFVLCPKARIELMKRFVELGVPQEFADLIQHLEAGRVSRAWAILDEGLDERAA